MRKKQKQHRLLTAFIITVLIISSMTIGAFAGTYTSEYLESLKEIVVDFYVDSISTEQLNGNTPQEIFSNLDQHSVYYTERELNELYERMTGDYAGIGAYIKEDNGKIIIEQPMVGSPAEKAGLLPGDEIYSVDGEVIRGLTATEGSAKVRGPVGTKIVLGIIRGMNDYVIEYTIERAQITNIPVSYEIIDGIGYIQLSEFNGHAYEYFAKALGELAKENVKQAIVDLRNNPGGNLDQVVRIAGLLVPPNPILHIGYKDEYFTYSSFSTLQPFDSLVILVNEGSASASEILAAAVQDTGSGTIIGKSTYGKGTVQQIVGLSNNEGFKITVARYLSPNKKIIDEVGVIPDIEIGRWAYEIQTQEFQPLSYDNVYKPGDTSEEIEGIQQRLKILGYSISDATGVYGSTTAAAIAEFIKDNELEEAAELTPEIQAAIEYSFIITLYSREYDMQLKTAIEYLKAGNTKAIAQ